MELISKFNLKGFIDDPKIRFSLELLRQKFDYKTIIFAPGPGRTYDSVTEKESQNSGLVAKQFVSSQ